MKDKLKNWIIALIVIIILIIPIIVSNINSKKVSIETFEDFNSSISSTSFSIVYFGDTSKNYDSQKEIMRNLRTEYSIDASIVDSKTLTASEQETLSALNDQITEGTYAIISDGEITYVATDATEEELSHLVNKYYNHVIEDDEISYKTVSTYKEYMALVNSKKITMAVFGRNSCSWCNKYKPVYNDIASEYDLDIYYFDSDSFDSTEYNKILNSGLTIPAKCTGSEEEPLSSGFGTPLTIFTQNGKTIDCISGYTNKTGLISALQEVGLIK
jgi:thiol-disulfide isomerase/thioredoxin